MQKGWSNLDTVQWKRLADSWRTWDCCCKWHSVASHLVHKGWRSWLSNLAHSSGKDFPKEDLEGLANWFIQSSHSLHVLVNCTWCFHFGPWSSDKGRVLQILKEVRMHITFPDELVYGADETGINRHRITNVSSASQSIKFSISNEWTRRTFTSYPPYVQMGQRCTLLIHRSLQTSGYRKIIGNAGMIGMIQSLISYPSPRNGYQKKGYTSGKLA